MQVSIVSSLFTVSVAFFSLYEKFMIDHRLSLDGLAFLIALLYHATVQFNSGQFSLIQFSSVEFNSAQFS